MASIELSLTDEQRALRAGVLEICKRYPGEYWRDLDARREYPEKFVTELTEAGYLAALIPPEYGGAGLGIREGGLILETINYSGGNAGACHAQMYIMGTVLRHGSEARRLRRARCDSRRSASPSRTRAPIRRSFRRRQSARAIATSSTARRSSSRACSSPI